MHGPKPAANYIVCMVCMVWCVWYGVYGMVCMVWYVWCVCMYVCGRCVRPILQCLNNAVSNKDSIGLNHAYTSTRDIAYAL